MFFVVVRSGASLAVNSENEASCSDASNSLFEASLLVRRVHKNRPERGTKFHKELPSVSRWFHFFFAIRFLRLPSLSRWFHFGRLECLNVLFFQFSKL